MTMTTTPEAIAQAILSLPRPLLLGFDVDGTLAPIVDDPAAASVPAPVQSALRRLARQDAVSVALITGRDRAALSKMARVPGAYRAVEHGRVVIAPGQRPPGAGLSRADQQRLSAFSDWVQAVLVPEGAELETKPQSRGVHVRRLAQRAPQRADAVLRQASSQAKKLGLHVRSGRAVVEAELQPGDKGAALRAIAADTGARGTVYAGDDITDVPALRAAVALGGLGLFVRSPERPRKPRGVSHAIAGPTAVAALIRALADRLCTAS